MEPTADIGLIGLAVMGQNLVLNMNDHGFTVAVFNRTVSKVDQFLAGEARGTRVIGTHSVEELCAHLKRPRRVMLMVQAGKAVDMVIDEVLPYLEKGDIIIDGGNSNYEDTIRRGDYLASRGIYFLGVGISGGEEGARHGPSIMPGGSPEAWPAVKPIFQAIAAKVADGTPCCDWVGKGGAGHFVKMVHNGIEYGDIQLICEAYDLLGRGLGMSCDEMSQVFDRWNQGRLSSYLIDITSDVLAFKDPEDGQPMLDKILDVAGQKGTGKWTALNALNLGVPLTLITEAVFSRDLSARKEERVEASRVLSGPSGGFQGDRAAFVADLEQALYAAKIMSYAQGYLLLRATDEFGWDLNYGGIALMWREGCIIRSAFLGNIKEAFDRDPNLKNLLLDPFFRQAVEEAQGGWRRVVARAVEMGIPTP
ncbi:MAG TPA: decarboxylating NADP(+)-dependent phosphogluconate dehydrogenase, partial [Candidatus Nitrosotenuis sp.]|nr:decarboxylating NADP(+)-dependent phosphogluconate dehydrogenase [Candidatus Nitrosotenuis sp.]